MTESVAQSRAEQVREILDSVAECKKRLDEIMERFQWTRDKLLPKDTSSAKPSDETEDTREAEEIEPEPGKSLQMADWKPYEISYDFSKSDDPNKLLPKATSPPKPTDGTEGTKEGEVYGHYEPKPAKTLQMGESKLNEISCDFPVLDDRGKRNLTSYTDLNKLKRDMRRRRMKHRVTKTAPLTYTEEIRELIAMQMEIEKSRHELAAMS